MRPIAIFRGAPNDRLYAQVRSPRLAYVAVFATQASSTEPVWYFPALEERWSLPLASPDLVDGPVLLPDEIPVSANHQPGRLAIYAIFTETRVDALEANSYWTALYQRTGQSGYATAALLDELETMGAVVYKVELNVLERCGGTP